MVSEFMLPQQTFHTPTPVQQQQHHQQQHNQNPFDTKMNNHRTKSTSYPETTAGTNTDDEHHHHQMDQEDLARMLQDLPSPGDVSRLSGLGLGLGLALGPGEHGQDGLHSEPDGDDSEQDELAKQLANLSFHPEQQQQPIATSVQHRMPDFSSVQSESSNAGGFTLANSAPTEVTAGYQGLNPHVTIELDDDDMHQLDQELQNQHQLHHTASMAEDDDVEEEEEEEEDADLELDENDISSFNHHEFSVRTHDDGAVDMKDPLGLFSPPGTRSNIGTAVASSSNATHSSDMAPLKKEIRSSMDAPATHILTSSPEHQEPLLATTLTASPRAKILMSSPVDSNEVPPPGNKNTKQNILMSSPVEPVSNISPIGSQSFPQHLAPGLSSPIGSTSANGPSAVTKDSKKGMFAAPLPVTPAMNRARQDMFLTPVQKQVAGWNQSAFQTPASSFKTPGAALKNNPETPQTQSSPSSVFPTEYYGMLAEVRKECQHLRQLNDRLMASNEEARGALELAMADKAKAVEEIRAEYQKNLELAQTGTLRKIHQYEEEISSLRHELQVSRSSQLQISSIREALMKEKELDVLAIKKEILSQKERQLHALRKEMMDDKTDVQTRLREEIDRREKISLDIQRRLESELDNAQKTISDLRSQVKPEKMMVSLEIMSDECMEDLYSRVEYEKLQQQLEDVELERQSTVTELADIQKQYADMHSDLKTANQKLVKYQQTVTDKDRLIEDLRRALAWKGPMVERGTSMSGNSVTAASSSLHGNHSSEQTAISMEDHQRELEDTARTIKTQCTHAYELAVQQLKEEFARMEDRLKQRYHKEKEVYQGELEKKLRSELGLHDTKSEEILALEQKLTEMNKLHRKEMRQLEVRIQSENEQVTQKMKSQYLETLRKMRDDVAASKQRSLDRVRVEWEKRKRELDGTWQDRMDTLKQEYEARLAALAPATKPILKSSSTVKPKASMSSRRMMK